MSRKGTPGLDWERQLLAVMVDLYCRERHGTAVSEPCRECRELIEHAEERLRQCPYGQGKPACQDCPVHCYQPEMRERVRRVMQYAGPRMLTKHPVLAYRHWKHRRARASQAPPGKDARERS